MATTYAMPTGPGHGGHAHSHSSHSRTAAVQRIPLQTKSMNGGCSPTGSSAFKDPLIPNHKLEEDALSAVEASPALQSAEEHTSELSLLQPSSFSSPSMGRRKSVGLPTHLNVQGNGYAFSAASTQKLRDPHLDVRRPWITAQEVMSAILIPLPSTLASLVLNIGILPQVSRQQISPIPSLDDIAGEGTDQRPQTAAVSSIAIVCGMTTMTLAVIGLGGKSAQSLGTLNGGGESTFMGALKSSNFIQLGRRIAGRVLVVGLPFYAASHLGGIRTGSIMLSSLASNIMASEERLGDLSSWKDVKQILGYRKWTTCSLILQLFFDLTGMTSGMPIWSMGLGYLALGLAIFAFPPPFPSSNPRLSIMNTQKPSAESANWDQSSIEQSPTSSTLISPLIRTSQDAEITLVTAALLGTFGVYLSFTVSSSAGATSYQGLAWSALTVLSTTLSLLLADIKSIQNGRGFGLTIGLFVSFTLLVISRNDGWLPSLCQSISLSVLIAGTYCDTHISSSQSSLSTQHHHHRHARPTSGSIPGASRFTNFVLRRVQPWPLLHTIIVEKDSRRIFYFMCLNFAFMLVQTFYGIVSGSLGLLSDSIHMFFDCLALVVGLSAAVMSKWPPSTRFPYGYAKIETLAGFANGVFLMLISVEIIYEALERLSIGSNVKRLNELMTVSILGFAINIIGILAFGHAHHGHGHDHSHEHSHEHHDHSSHEHHSHERNHEHTHEQTHEHSCQDHVHNEHDHHHRDHDHDHDHDHAKPKLAIPTLNGHANHVHDQLQVPSPSPSIYSSVPATPSKPTPARSHSHHHHGHHDHGHHHSENMMGIYLHVLGDTLGSAAVVLSTWLVQLNGWSGWDPLASTAIAIIIFGTAIPLVKSCARKLLLTVPEDTEYDLREALVGLSGLRGVAGCAVPKFWITDGEQRLVMGVVHVMADRTCNLEDVRERCMGFLQGAGLDVLVQVERDGVGRCWCQATGAR